MKYDVFLVSAIADLEKADQVAKRLRALKFKVRFDKKREHTVATPKDVKDANDSRSVLVLWSKTANKKTLPDSDWVHAMAHQARARPGVLVQAGLDRSKPDQPFETDTRHSLIGLEPKKILKGFNSLADAVGDNCGRVNLSSWLVLGPRQKDERDIWRRANPTDPLSVVPASTAASTKTRKTASKAASSKSKSTRKTSTSIPLAEVTSSSRTVRPKASPLKLKPPTPPVPKEASNQSGRIVIGCISVGIAALFLFSYLSKSKSASLPAVANSSLMLAERCPPGQIPAELIAPPLAHGEIIDDTTPSANSNPVDD